MINYVAIHENALKLHNVMTYLVAQLLDVCWQKPAYQLYESISLRSTSILEMRL